jgi:hypothetical protein
MTTKDDGGPAFPVLMGAAWHGISVRDYFAGKALEGAAGNPSVGGSPKEFAESAYIYADAMLEARKL